MNYRAFISSIVLTLVFFATSARAADLSVVVIPIDEQATGNYYQVYLGNRGNSSATIDGFHLKNTHPSYYFFSDNLRLYSLGGSWDLLTSDPNFTAALAWSSSGSLSAHSGAMISTESYGSNGPYLFAVIGSGGWAPALPGSFASVYQFGIRADSTVTYSGQICYALAGDANMDGKVDSTDSGICSGYSDNQAVSGDYSNPTWTKCDFDGNGYVSASEKAIPAGANANKACDTNGSYQ